jgi:hypothetical protein
VQPVRPRSRRYPFVAHVELTDMQSASQSTELTSDLSVFGCQVDSQKPLPVGTKVRIRITHGSANFVALGKVAYVIPNAGMGIVFSTIEPKDQLILEEWVSELRDRSRRN